MKLTFITALVIAFSIFSNSGDWKLKKEEEGIKVFVRDNAETKIKELKLTTMLTTRLSSLVYVIADKNDYMDWVYSCSESKVLKQVNKKESYHYQVTDAPWPVTDRDLILHTRIEQQANKQVDIDAVGIADYLGEKSGRIRVPSYHAHWKIIPLGTGQCSVEYTVSVDPGGFLPKWVINMAISEAPVKTMLNLKKRLQRFQNIQLDYIQEPQE